MEVDPQLRAELEVCETYRIPHSHYLGGPLRWTPLDRAKTEAYTAWKNAACPGCHTRREEWDPKRGGHRHAYIAHADRCPGCELKAQEWDNIQAGEGKAHGIRVGLKPNPALLPEVMIDEAPERVA